MFVFDGSQSGRSDAADWIRNVKRLCPQAEYLVNMAQAYHDMAAQNVADGTGGMDGSIRFFEEQSRAENAGNGFSNTSSPK
ncbi:Peroxidase [Mycena venus]|uniref:Peroxidase n=1 Tax=Mycena venus TaxID=2733690 RepID=A0A8H7D5X9_9AGAR|nr:Peroxidase [Mycena venus]